MSLEMACEIKAGDVISALEAEHTSTLATCAGNRVTIRPISHVNEGLNILFQTGKNSLKMQQIRENPNVALCVGTYEIEGEAIEAGRPLAEENAAFVRLYMEKHPGSYERYSALQDETVVKLTVRHVRQWRYINGEPLLAELRFQGEHIHEN